MRCNYEDVVGDWEYIPEDPNSQEVEGRFVISLSKWQPGLGNRYDIDFKGEPGFWTKIRLHGNCVEREGKRAYILTGTVFIKNEETGKTEKHKFTITPLEDDGGPLFQRYSRVIYLHPEDLTEGSTEVETESAHIHTGEAAKSLIRIMHPGSAHGGSND